MVLRRGNRQVREDVLAGDADGVRECDGSQGSRIAGLKVGRC